MNPLAETSWESGNRRHDVNLQFIPVGNAVLKVPKMTLGGTATVLSEYTVDRISVGTGSSRPPSRPLHAGPAWVSGFRGIFRGVKTTAPIVRTRSFASVKSIQPARPSTVSFSWHSATRDRPEFNRLEPPGES